MWWSPHCIQLGRVLCSVHGKVSLEWKRAEQFQYIIIAPVSSIVHWSLAFMIPSQWVHFTSG